MKALYTSFALLLSIVLTPSALAQEEPEEDPSCLAPSKKAQKALDAATSAGDAQSAVVSFNKAIEADPENAGVYFTYGVYAYEGGKKYYDNFNQASGDRSFKTAEGMLMKAAELCNDYHSDIYYLLGVINYAQQETPVAMEWFEKFLKFKNDDPTRYNASFMDQQRDVKEVLAQFKEEQELLSKVVPFQPALVKNVSTKEADENFPMISPDNELMFFTRKTASNKSEFELVGKMVEELTKATRADDEQPFDGGKPVGAPFDDAAFSNFGASTLSADNKELIICGCKKTEIQGQAYNNCDLYSTTYERVDGVDKWTPLVNLGPQINTPNGWESQPSLSADGQTLFFTASRPTTRDNDIFIAKRKSDGTWGEARPFDEINTDAKDKGPFLHQDSETLYFVSSSTDSRKGVGGLDIFYTREENGSWSKPKNIGYPINSVEDELGLFVSIDGKLAYFSSRSGGDFNIYSFELYEEARPKKVAILKGELSDAEGTPVTNATIEVAYENSEKVEQVRVNGNDGRYAVIVKQEQPQDVMISVKKEGAAFDSKLISKEDIGVKENRINNDLGVKELKVGEAYTINDILYPTTSAELNQRSKFILREFARYMKTHPGITILIQGHTDDEGDDALNLDLSDRRANGVKDYLVSQGVAVKRLEAKGFGETQPKVPNDSPENKAKNRRTDFVIVGM